MYETAENDKFYKKFEEYFKASYMSNDYYLKSKISIDNNSSTYIWDYGIYDKKNKQLQMLIDLDNSYFTLDNYDNNKYLFVPNNTKVGIMYEKDFTKSFEYILRTLFDDYEDFIDGIWYHCINTEFPYPFYSKNELIKSWNELYALKCDEKHHKDISLNSRVGDHIIQHYHSSIYHARIKGKPSPYEAWHDYRLLRKCIENRIVFQHIINPSKILQGFNVCKIAPKVSVFSAARAKVLIYKYLNEYDEIFDPFSGFSGRLLGACSLGKHYIGQDINPIHVEESLFMINNLFTLGIKLNANIQCKDIFSSSGKYPCLFTCSPYSDKEIWINNDKLDNLSCDQWIDECLQRFDCKKYLFVVDKTFKYKDNIVSLINNKSHLNHNMESIVLIEK